MNAVNSHGGQFKQAYITDRTEKSVGNYSFADLVADFGDTRIDVLKMDIEGESRRY